MFVRARGEMHCMLYYSLITTFTFRQSIAQEGLFAPFALEGRSLF